jgi:hypothetical protein
MNVIRIDEGIFERLIVCMREHQDPENMEITLENEFGDVLVYENTIITIIHNDTQSNKRVWCDINLEQLCKEQRQAINAVLIQQVHRVVHNIIEEVLDVE